MFTRVVEIRTKTAKAKEFSAAINDKILPMLRNQQGFIDEITLISSTEPDRILALSFWQSEADAERYHQNQFNNVTQILTPLLETMPRVQTYHVDTSTTHHIVKGKAA